MFSSGYIFPWKFKVNWPSAAIKPEMIGRLTRYSGFYTVDNNSKFSGPLDFSAKKGPFCLHKRKS
jgi:hypothetical protein